MLETMLEIGYTEDETALITAGAMWFEEQGGLNVSSYLNDAQTINGREELLLIASLTFALGGVYTKNSEDENFQKFQIAFLYFLKLNAMSVVSLVSLLTNNCYPDSFSVCRSLHARSNLILLVSFQPELFRDWLQNPKESCYLEGHIRTELEKHGVSTMSHIYELASELIHNQYQAGVNVGYFERGLFPTIPSIENQICVYAKYVLASIAYSAIHVGLLSDAENEIKSDLRVFCSAFERTKKNYLFSGRMEHLWASIGEERHWEKKGKGKYKIGGLFEFSDYLSILTKFQSAKGKGQRKKLGKEYVRRTES